jgi:16S rRNA (guanine966-N2)-methyltransferase
MRITGGTLRSRALVAPSGDRTRPTSDRVREALFGILASQGRVASANVLDLYAGTGGLAYEALSRGADRATLVDVGRDAVTAAKKNAAALGLEGRSLVIGSPVERATSAILARGPFELVLVDPPYADVASALRALAALAAAGAFAADALVILEHATRDLSVTLSLVPEAFTSTDQRRYGDTSLLFLATTAKEQVG